MGRLDGKVAIVTGGASGMGRATVQRFVEEGARVVIGDVQGEPGAAFARELGTAARFQLTDVSREADVEALVAHALDEFGQLDCMFNNAGFGGIGGNLVDLELGDAYRNTVDVLFTGVVAGTMTPIRRAGIGADIAAMALYLASDESTFVTGQQFVVDGGLMAGNPSDPSRPSGIQELADRIESES